MKRILHNFFAVATLLALSFSAYGQGVTTTSISGRIIDDSGESLVGANIYAVHLPSGTSYGSSTDLEGYYRIPNMRVGGPYKITMSYTGYGSQEFNDVILRLGEKQKFDVSLTDTSTDLVSVEVVAKAGSAGTNAGASTQVGSEQIESLPTLDRNLGDFTRLTPQASGNSFGGINNRFNAIYVDGAVNNDVFGLAASGTNGGQTGAAPFSIDIIDQLQIVLSPYDVSLGGFAGGGINAVTKSGTNQFQGTAYYFNKNQAIAGKTPGRLAERLGETFEPTKFDDFTEQIFGASLGGPLIENKLFFFANFEIQRDETPAPFEFGQYEGDSDEAALNGLRDRLINEFNYDPGTFGNTSDQLDASRFFIKFDYNISKEHRLTVRHNYNNLENFNRNAGSNNRINFSNNGVYFPSVTNSTAVELNSTFGNRASNNLIIGYTRVKDNRDPLGSRFPNVSISDGGSNSIRFGSEAFSTGNLLEQSTFSLTDNFKLYRGKHTFTIGTHNEFYGFNNVFIRQNFGAYQFDSLDDFLNGEEASAYDRTYSLIDNGIGDDTEAAANFNAVQLGVYAQDEFEVNNKLTVTAGLRIDVPFILDDPLVNPQLLQDSTFAKLSNAYEVAGNANAGQAPSGQLMFSPRAGFNYNFKDEGKTTLRGGLGIFTSRIPFVWPGGMFTNNGAILGSVDERDINEPVLFRGDINNQYINEDAVGTAPGGQVDLFVDDFKYPQVFRTNLAIERELPGGIRATVEGIFTKTLNNMLITNVNSDPALDFNWTGTPDTRDVYTRTRLAPELNGDVYVASNTSQGYTYNVTATLAKDFNRNFNVQASYTYGDAYAVNEGTSSQNSSGWRGQTSINGRNNPVYGRSDFALGHRVIANMSYIADWTGDGRFATSFNLFASGAKTTAYSYVLGPDRNFRGQNPNNERGSASRSRSLVYIPATMADINLVDIVEDGTVVSSAADQWAALDAFISGDDYLSENRGGYSEKNGAWAPFQGFFDFGIRQNVGFQVGNNIQRFQLSLDVFNLANLLNSDWGTSYQIPGDFNNRILYNVVGFEADGTTPQFTYTDNEPAGKESLNISGNARWQARVGIRYLFN